MKKLLLVLCLFFSAGMTNVSAQELKDIPGSFESDTIIEFSDSYHYRVLSKVESQKIDFSVLHEPQEPSDLDHDRAFVEEYPLPVKGMYVVYGSDGEVNDIYTKDTTAYYRISYLDDQYSTAGVEDAHFSVVKQWGSCPNILYRRENHGLENFHYDYLGKGRATVFSDRIGQKNHVLKKGDVALKLSCDNRPTGIAVRVTMPKKGGGLGTYTMYKWDGGGMPNAIVDIWKTGVENWGYSYSSTWSAGNVTIKHN